MRPREPWITRPERRFGLQLVGIFVVVGILLGFVWRLWATTATAGLVIAPNTVIPDETEGFISSDGRFVLLTVPVGLLVGIFAWTRRPTRGPVVVAALGIGGIVAALVTDVIGELVGGGAGTGKVGTDLPRLQLFVHASGLLALEALAAVGVYFLATMFASSDDLGTDPVGGLDGPVAISGRDAR